jgi:DNA polymerase-4
VIEPLDGHRALIDLSAHPRPADLLKRMADTVEQVSGCSVKWGVGPNRALARLAQEVLPFHADPLEIVNAFPRLPVGMLLSVPFEVRKRLDYLGYRTIGEVASLPLQTLRTQFADDALCVYRAARGKGDTLVHPLWPMDSISRHTYFDSPAGEKETLERALKRITGLISRTLSERELSGKTAELILEYDEHEPEQISRTFTKPFQGAASLYSALKLLLPDQLPGRVTGIRVRTPSLSRAQRTQTAIPIFLDRSESDLRVNSTLRHVKATFGDSAVMLGSEKATPRRVMVLRAWQNATGWR